MEKTVLFVAEKMAALEVVKRRLDATGVGDACLELHSSKANKRALLEELRGTWELGAPKGQGAGTLYARLLTARDRLNAHAVRMHTPEPASSLTPFQVIGQLSRLRLDGEKPSDIALVQPERWSNDDFAERHDVVRELIERIGVIGRPDDHAWRGVGLASITPTDAERLTARITALVSELVAYDAEQTEIAALLSVTRPTQFDGLDAMTGLAARVATAPALSRDALGSNVWSDDRPALDDLLSTGSHHAVLMDQLKSVILPEGLHADVTEPTAALAPLPDTFSLDAFVRVGEAAAILPRLEAEAQALAGALGRDAPTTLEQVRSAVRVGERVATAPEASPEAFAADLWDTGVERAADVAAAVAQLETARTSIETALTDAAWDMDLSHARGVLASHGSGFLKIFSGEWRRANRLVRSVLTHPDAPLDETLAALDALARGRAARRTIEDEAAFAATAFASDWRGDRSSSAPLLALTEWMRSLKGLGAEPRLIAAKRPGQKRHRRQDCSDTHPRRTGRPAN